MEALGLLWAIYPQLCLAVEDSGHTKVSGMTFSGVRCLTTLPSTSSHLCYSGSSVLKGSAQSPFKAVLFKMVPTSVTFCSQQPVL